MPNKDQENQDNERKSYEKDERQEQRGQEKKLEGNAFDFMKYKHCTVLYKSCLFFF